MTTEIKKISDRLLLQEFKTLRFGSIFNGGRDVYDALEVDKFLNEIGYSVQDLENDFETLIEQTQSIKEDRKSRIEMESEVLPDDISEVADELRRQKLQYERKERAVMELMVQAEEQADAIREKAVKDAEEKIEKTKAQIRAMLNDATNKRDEMLADSEKQKHEVESQIKDLFNARQEVEHDLDNYATSMRQFAKSIEELSRKSS